MKPSVNKVALLLNRRPEGIKTGGLYFDEHNRQQFVRRHPNISLIHCATVEEFLQNAADAEVLWTLGGGRHRYDLDRVCDNAPNLKWVCAIMAGTEAFFETKVKDLDVIISNTRGIHKKPMSDHALAFIFSWLRNLPLSLKHQAQPPRWKQPPVMTLQESEGKTVGIIGLGSIGTEIAARTKALGFRVAAYKRTPVDCPHVDALYTEGQLESLLKESDFVISVVPLTPETRGMLGRAQFLAMKETAVLINLGRGGLVNTDELVRALKENVIAGACLDVTDPEPLPVEHELWRLPNAIITAHCAANSPRYFERATEVFCDEMDRFLKGLPLENLVERERGY
jgi:D-2-hydroxyacid dehydrogenase (NADP+)